jgi:hypothetical protein
MIKLALEWYLVELWLLVEREEGRTLFVGCLPTRRRQLSQVGVKLFKVRVVLALVKSIH